MRDLPADVGEHDDTVLGVGRRARHATDYLAVQRQLGVVDGQLAAFEREHAEPTVRVPAVVEPRDGLLAGVAALREAYRPVLETRLGGHDAIVELATEPRRARQDSQALELFLGDGRRLRRRLPVDSSTAGTP